jgi:hypothetical protein
MKQLHITFYRWILNIHTYISQNRKESGILIHLHNIKQFCIELKNHFTES